MGTVPCRVRKDFLEELGWAGSKVIDDVTTFHNIILVATCESYLANISSKRALWVAKEGPATREGRGDSPLSILNHRTGKMSLPLFFCLMQIFIYVWLTRRINIFYLLIGHAHISLNDFFVGWLVPPWNICSREVLLSSFCLFWSLAAVTEKILLPRYVDLSLEKKYPCYWSLSCRIHCASFWFI